MYTQICVCTNAYTPAPIRIRVCGMVIQLLMKPIDYGLSTDPLSDVAERNLKVLSTIMLLLLRRVCTPRDAPMMVSR